MILHMQPVADLHSVAIDRQRLARQRVQEEQRDQLFRKLIRAIIIGAVGRRRLQSIGVVIGADEMVRGRLGRRIGRVWRIGRVFVKGGIVRPQSPVYLVGRDMVEAVGASAALVQPDGLRSEEHTSELQSLMRISYAVFCLKKKNKTEKICTST